MTILQTKKVREYNEKHFSTAQEPAWESDSEQTGRLDGQEIERQTCRTPAHQVGNDVIALFLQPHENARSVQAATVGQNHGAFAGHRLERAGEEFK